MGDSLLYEMPANTLLRMSLRYEYLHKMAVKYSNLDSQEDSRVAIGFILDLLALLDKPELRSKFLQEFSRLNIYLSKLFDKTDIDKQKLSQTMDTIHSHIEILNRCNGKFAELLRHKSFIKGLIQQNQIPGGLCEYNTPALDLWLSKTKFERQSLLLEWLHILEDTTITVKGILSIIRNSAQQETARAKGGFYQKTLDPNLPCHLIQVRLAKNSDVYPSISIGRHGISIQFLRFNIQEDPKKTDADLNFQLGCCIL